MKLSLPELRVGNLILREPIEGDAFDLFQFAKEDMCKTLNWGPLKSIYEAKYVVESYINRPVVEKIPSGYSIVYDDCMIGFIEYHNYNKSENSIEIGCYLDPLYWNMGIMFRCLKECIKLAFDYLDVDKIVMGHTQNNLRCQCLVKKLGFKYECEKRVLMGDKYYELGYYYSLYKYERNDL
ncbi:MAG: GNAT family N-acetyltransferase [Acholeplasmatales bacterium]|nr:GNAT family N-acetyltransferase [Acholeplasmatales bacterium]